MTDPVRPQKRSVTIAGHRTSASLEDEFWQALRTLAAGRKLSLNALIAEIDESRGRRSLSGALRVFVLEQAKAGRLE